MIVISAAMCWTSNTREGVWELPWHAWHDGYTNRYPITLVEEVRSRVTRSGCKPHLLLTEEDRLMSQHWKKLLDIVMGDGQCHPSQLRRRRQRSSGIHNRCIPGWHWCWRQQAQQTVPQLENGSQLGFSKPRIGSCILWVGGHRPAKCKRYNLTETFT
jgi:hypothetical protein